MEKIASDQKNASISIKLINVSVHKAVSSSIGKRKRCANYPSLGLIILAGLTPKDIQVSIVEDNNEEINYNEKTDLVGLSFLTPAAYRAYEIAERFREKNVPVVMGGVHVSALPEEASKHADAIVIGEAEETWPQLLEDLKNGKLKKVYKADNYVNLSRIPMARRELLNKKYYITTNVIQTSRGCPFDCEFCSIGALFGRKARFRPIGNVIEEIKTMDNQFILFTDDNLAINKKYAKDLFRALIPLKKKWFGEASWNIKNDPELLKLASKSGCKGLLIGFESLQNQDNIRKASRHKDMKKTYFETIDMLHNHGIAVIGAFIFGFDNDDESVFDETIKFSIESDIEILELNTLIPFPGTPLYSRLKREERIIEDDWRKYTYYPPGICFYPKQITTKKLKSNMGRIYRRFYKLRLIIPRAIRVWKRFRNIRIVMNLFILSLYFRKRIRHGY